MNPFKWLKERLKDEEYVTNVKLAEDVGLTYQPELYKDCTMRPLPRFLNAHDIWMAGGWRDKQ